jgi:predicted CoA-binding protein
VATIAVIGASNDRQKYGNRAVRAFRHQGHTVVAVNPKETMIEGEPAYASVLDYPGAIDEATFYVQPDVGLEVLDEIARKHIPVVWLNPGADDPRLVARARALGLRPVVACSIMGHGERPSDY